MKPICCTLPILVLGTVLPYFGPLACVIFYSDMFHGAAGTGETFINFLESVVQTNKTGFLAIIDNPAWGIIWWLAPVPTWVLAYWIYQKRLGTSDRLHKGYSAAIGSFIGLCIAPVPTAILAWNLTGLWEDFSSIFLMMAWWYPSVIASLIFGWLLGYWSPEFVGGRHR